MMDEQAHSEKPDEVMDDAKSVIEISCEIRHSVRLIPVFTLHDCHDHDSLKKKESDYYTQRNLSFSVVSLGFYCTPSALNTASTGSA